MSASTDNTVHSPERATAFVAGKPLTDIWGPAGLRWIAVLKGEALAPLRHPHLRFVRNDRCRFDLDNLVYPVLAPAGGGEVESVWATVMTGALEGVFITEELPPKPPAPPAAEVTYVANPPSMSLRKRDAIPELVSHK